MAKLWTSGGKLVQCYGIQRLGYDENCPCACSCFYDREPTSWPCGGLLETYTISEKKWLTKIYDPNYNCIIYDITETISYNPHLISVSNICAWAYQRREPNPCIGGFDTSNIGFRWYQNMQTPGWLPIAPLQYVDNQPYSTDKKNPTGSYYREYLQLNGIIIHWQGAIS